MIELPEGEVICPAKMLWGFGFVGDVVVAFRCRAKEKRREDEEVERLRTKKKKKSRCGSRRRNDDEIAS